MDRAARKERSQPENEKDYLFLKKLGIKTIINLRSDSSVVESANMATRLGLKQINIPLNTQTTSPEYKAAVKQFFEIVSDPQAPPILFHCRYGKDRTGLMAAMYRVFKQQMTPKNAFTEWRGLGLSDEWGTKIQDYFWDAVRDEIQPLKSKIPTCARMLK